MTNDRPYSVAVAPNGARRGRADHPRLPLTPGEIARDAAEAREAGAAMIHLHVRDGEGRHTLDADLYRDTIVKVRQAVGDDLIIQITTEAVGRFSQAEQIAVIDALSPKSVSIALREIVPNEESELAAAALFERMEARGILHQIILYEAGELARLNVLAKRGVLPDGPLNILAVLGRYSEAETKGDEAFDAFLSHGLARHAWMMCAFGPREPYFMKKAALAGGDARVGFENNLWLPDGRLAPDNRSLVTAAVAAGRASQRPPGNADALRRYWRSPALCTDFQFDAEAAANSPDTGSLPSGQH